MPCYFINSNTSNSESDNPDFKTLKSKLTV